MMYSVLDNVYGSNRSKPAISLVGNVIINCKPKLVSLKQLLFMGKANCHVLVDDSSFSQSGEGKRLNFRTIQEVAIPQNKRRRE